MNLEAALREIDRLDRDCLFLPGYCIEHQRAVESIKGILRALCSEPAAIRIEDLRIGMRVRTKDGARIVNYLSMPASVGGWPEAKISYEGDRQPHNISDVLEILP